MKIIEILLNSVKLKVSQYFNEKFIFSHQLSLGEYINEI